VDTRTDRQSSGVSHAGDERVRTCRPASREDDGAPQRKEERDPDWNIVRGED
jgi:hypothetical protein